MFISTKGEKDNIHIPVVTIKKEVYSEIMSKKNLQSTKKDLINVHVGDEGEESIF